MQQCMHIQAPLVCIDIKMCSVHTAAHATRGAPPPPPPPPRGRETRTPPPPRASSHQLKSNCQFEIQQQVVPYTFALAS
jgi:hypothetical protein